MIRRLPSVLTLLTALLLSVPSFGQGQEIGYRVVVGTNKFVRIKLAAPPKKVARVIPKGTVIETNNSTTLTLNGTSAVIESTNRRRILQSDSTVYAKAAVDTIPHQGQPKKKYRANIVQSKDTIYINYQLFPAPIPTPLPDSPRCRKGILPMWVATKPCAPKRDLSKAPKEDPNKEIIEGIKFNRKDTYYIKLYDRQAVGFKSYARELAALTVPFQYRPGHSRDGKQAYGQLNVDANLGVYVGAKFGRVTYRYRQREVLTPNKYSFSVGPFLSLTRVSLDSTNTRLATDRHNLNRNIASLSAGLAVAVDIRDFRVGLFYGKDFAIGSKQWDFDRRYWWGVGFGYKLAILSKKD